MDTTRLKKYWTEAWPVMITYGLLFAVLAGLLYMQLGTLLPGYSANEAATYESSLSLSQIFDNPINAPFTLLVHGLTYLSEQSYLLTRVAATLFGMGVLAIFCRLMHIWYGMRTAFIGTAMLGTSAWFLHAARLGTPDILLFGLVALVAAGVWLKRSNNPFVLLLCFLLAGGAFYIPGMIWFVVFVAFWEWKQIDFLFKRHLWAVSLGALLFLAMLAPLAWAVYRTPELLKTLLGLPAQGWPNIVDVLQNLWEVPLAVFIRAPVNPEMWLGNLPVLDVFAAAMFVLGAYLYLKYSRLSRAKLFIPVLLVGWLLAALGGSVSLSILVPFLYIIVAVGVSFLLDSWLNVFPRNPIAKILGFALIGLAVLAALNFQLRHYFIAWPNNVETHQVFTLQAPPPSDTIEQ